MARSRVANHANQGKEILALHHSQPIKTNLAPKPNRPQRGTPPTAFTNKSSDFTTPYPRCYAPQFSADDWLQGSPPPPPPIRVATCRQWSFQGSFWKLLCPCPSIGPQTKRQAMVEAVAAHRGLQRCTPGGRNHAAHTTVLTSVAAISSAKAFATSRSLG